VSQPSQLSSKKLIKLYRNAVQRGISLDALEKKISKKIKKLEVSQKLETKQERERVKTIKRKLPKIVRYGALILPITFVVVGIFLMGNAVLPIISYYTATLPKLTKNELLAPIPQEEVLDVTPLVVATTQSDQTGATLGTSVQNGPVILDTQLDYTNLSNWFQDQRSELLEQTQDQTEYTIDIPKVNIVNAKVKIGGTDLNQSLIAYPGTGLPGKRGAPVIFGHSVLRQFYNPAERNPRRYNSIFSYIMTLEEGDEIFVTYEGVRYKYVVRDKSEVKPEDTYILAQQYDSKRLKLVTCVPEGTYLRRGVITAELVPG
jgi:sortase A